MNGSLGLNDICVDVYQDANLILVIITSKGYEQKIYL